MCTLYEQNRAFANEEAYEKEQEGTGCRALYQDRGTSNVIHPGIFSRTFDFLGRWVSVSYCENRVYLLALLLWCLRMPLD
jgi:hypothetical protein